ncbi:unknown protein [Microcystis aeruginosa NIES-843]|uniref:Uncharacterized protein n=1 Tax=Microcystis aeruginosa (strain NIES-843 / IAM M-2473) TaxID=449447 RepID=B0JUS4_MICAN|nr:unknown protein [Microcystis aeruginosa NIES-843]
MNSTSKEYERCIEQSAIGLELLANYCYFLLLSLVNVSLKSETLTAILSLLIIFYQFFSKSSL